MNAVRPAKPQDIQLALAVDGDIRELLSEAPMPPRNAAPAAVTNSAPAAVTNSAPAAVTNSAPAAVTNSAPAAVTNSAPAAAPKEIGAADINSLIERAARGSVKELDSLIAILQHARNQLASENERIQRAIVKFVQASHSTMESAKVIADSMSAWKPSAPPRSDRT